MEILCGSEAKGDCLVAAETVDAPRTEISTKSEQLLMPGLRSVVDETRAALGVENVSLRVADLGALDYVVAARIETAVRALNPDASQIAPAVERKRSQRDRPRRSRLYAPGNNPRLLAGIDIHGADCVLLDLEDSVPPAEKVAARILVKHLLAAVPFPDEVWVRINPLDAGGIDDLEDVLRGCPNGICLPKAESAEDVGRLDRELARIEDDLGLPVGSTWIMPIVETARGVFGCEAIAMAGERVVMIAFGAEDYTRDIGARRTRESLLFARSTIVAACAAAGIQASDTVFADLDDMAGLAEEAAHARDLGFNGKGAINPRQLDAIHRAFSPTADELAHARRVVEAAAEAEAAGSGAVALDGKMIDKPVLDRARRLITYGERLAGGGDAA